MVGNLVVARERRVDRGSTAHHVRKHAVHDQVADDDAHRRAEHRVDAAAMTARSHVSPLGAHRRWGSLAEGQHRPVSGTVIKSWDTLKELDQTSGATLAVSASVIANARRLRALEPRYSGRARRRGRRDRRQLGCGLETHGVSNLGHVSRRSSARRLPGRRRLGDGAAVRNVRVDVPGDHRAERRDLRAYADRVPGAVRRERRPDGHGVANLRQGSPARSSSTAAPRRPRWSIRRGAGRRSRS